MMETLLTTLPSQRPAPTNADRDYWRKTLTPVGPLREGDVLVYEPNLGTGYVRERSTGELFAFAMKFIVPPISIATGMFVRFRANANQQIVEFTA